MRSLLLAAALSAPALLATTAQASVTPLTPVEQAAWEDEAQAPHGTRDGLGAAATGGPRRRAAPTPSC